MRQDYLGLILGFVGIWITQANYVVALDVRLVGGDTPFDGRVEVDVNGWRLMCDSYLHINVATTVCRMLGYPVTNVTLKNDTITDWDRWIVCRDGDADIFSECGWAVWPDYECKPEESLGISCNGNVRLEDGTNDMNGNLATYMDGDMITLCDHEADSRIATVVCRQLGMDTQMVAVTMGSYFGKSKPSNYYPKCNGDESSIEDCRLLEYTGSELCNEDHVLGIDCNATIFDVDMVDPVKFPVEGGRLNILYGVNAFWKERVPKFEPQQYKQLQNIASVMCGMLGLSRNSPNVFWVQSERYFDEFAIALSEGLRCTGSEVSLSNCAILADLSSVEENTTSSTELAIQCLRHLRLVDEDTNVDGLDKGVLVFQNESTSGLHPLADVYMDYRAAKVACHELGFTRNKVELKLIPASIDSLLAAVRTEFVCTGEETRLRGCQSKTSNTVRSDAIVWLNCDYKEDYLVYIQGPYRALRVKHLHGGADQSFCTTTSDLDDTVTAGVICHQNGYSRFGARFTQFAKTNSTTVFDDISRFACLGIEEYVHECPKYGNEPLIDQCVYEVGIQCQDTSTCQDPLHVIPKREITCVYSYCQGDSCSLHQSFNNVTHNCSVADGYACLRIESRTRSSVSLPLKTVSLNALCVERCTPYYQMIGNFHIEIRECCYADGCNSAHNAIQQAGRFRLKSGVMTGEGLVEVYSISERGWIVVADDERLTHQTLVNICIAAGHTSPQYVARSPDQFITSIWKNSVYNCMSVDPDVCNRNITLPNCISTKKSCVLGQRLRLNCNAQSSVRVRDGGAAHKGRVEIYIDQKWGTVCMPQRSASVDVVMCRSLGFHGYCNLNGPNSTHIRFRKGQGHIHISDVTCTGTESHVLQCRYNIVNESSGCTHEHDLGVVCDSYYPRYESNHVATTDNKWEFQPITDWTMETGEITSTESKQCHVGSCVLPDSCDEVLNETLGALCTALGDTYCYYEIGNKNGSINFGCTLTCNSPTQVCCERHLCNNIYQIQDSMIVPNFITTTNVSDNYVHSIDTSGCRSTNHSICHWVGLMIVSVLAARLNTRN